MGKTIPDGLFAGGCMELFESFLRAIAPYVIVVTEIIAIVDSFGLAWSSVIVGHIAVEQQPGIPRMVEISYHYCIPYTEPVFERVIYGVRFLCAKDDKNCSLDERSDFLDWDDTVGDNVIRHPLPPY